MQQRGNTQQGNVDGGGVVPGSIPATRHAAQPGSRILDVRIQGRGRVGVSWLATVGAGVCRACCVLPGQVLSREMAFVAQTAPQRSPDLRVVAPMHPPAFGSPSPALRFQRLEGFTGNHVGSPHARKEQQHVGSQVGQVVVAGLVLPPTARDLPAQNDQLPLRGFSPLIADRKLVSPGFQVRHLRLQTIDMSPGVGLSPVEAAGIQEQRRREPVALKVQHGGRDERPDSPVPTEHALHHLEIRQWSDGNLDDEIQHGVTRAICFGDLAQRGRETFPLLGGAPSRDRAGQGASAARSRWASSGRSDRGHGTRTSSSAPPDRGATDAPDHARRHHLPRKARCPL